ncbi:MAG: hydroxymethylbilane synthase [Lachnospiraceae bacterium]|nr:hydroxymethylbilane synthase [Lachnospiraceae bacterium]
MRKLILATRGSRLALAQADAVQAQLEKLGVTVEQKIVKTRGDRDRTSPLREIGGKGLFVKEIELQLQSGQADLAVHSGKDLPYVLMKGMTIAANPKAADARDCLIFCKNRELPGKPVIGTGSPRRIEACRKFYPDADFKDIRGNIDTRIRKLMESEYDAIVLAKAGIDRLGISMEDLELRVFEAEEFIPAACQGILAVECRSADEEVVSLLQQISDPEARMRFELERRIFCGLQADCSMAVGVHAEVLGDEVRLMSMYHGKRYSCSGKLKDAERLIEEIRKELI